MPKPLLPDVWFEIQDGALGILPPPSENVQVKIGVASQGPVGEIVALSSLEATKAALGSGPLAEAVAASLAMAGGTVYALRAPASVPGQIAPRLTSLTGTGSISVSGAPLDEYDLRVQILQNGNRGTATFRYTLDGGDVWSPEIAVPTSGTYPVPDSGLSLTFSDGASGTSFASGDLYAFTCTAPAYTLSDLNAAFDVLLADPREWGWVHVVGAASPAVAAAVAQRMAEAEATYRFAFAIVEAPDDTDANLLAQWASFASKRVGVVAGYTEEVSPLTGRVNRRSAAWRYTGRLAQIPIQEDPGRIRRGSLDGIVRLHRDEFATPGLDPAGFTTLRTIIGRRGFYVTNGRMKASEGSDFQYVNLRRVMDRACRVARNAALIFLKDNVRVDPQTGYILEANAQAIEAYIQGVLSADLVQQGRVSSVLVQVKRDVNLLSSRSLPIKVRVLPLATLDWIEVDIGFTNPALAPAG